jgi:hypothetical protein
VGLFCSLNLGVSGLIKNEVCLDYLKANAKIGDIIEVEVAEEFDFGDTRYRPLITLVLP